MLERFDPAHLEAVVQAVGTRKPKTRKPSFPPQVASIYNAVTDEAVDALTSFMRDFEQRHG